MVIRSIAQRYENERPRYLPLFTNICVTSAQGSEISLRLTLRPAVFELQGILRQEHQNDPKNAQGQMYP